MTVTANDRRREYPGNGVTTVFNGPMAYSASHIAAYLVDDVTGVSTQIPGGSLSITLLGRSSGTRVEVLSGAPALGITLLLLRVVPIAQEVDITNQSAFNAQVIERGYDLLCMQIQQMSDGLDRAIRAPETVIDFNGVVSTINPLSPLVITADGKGVESGSTTLTGDMLLRPHLQSTDATKGATLIYDKAGIAPERYGAIGDGATDDTAAVSAAVAQAIASGGFITWRGNYLTSESIPGLHSVRHDGPGSITRGGDIFYPCPKAGQVNRLYVSTSGSDSNDGLSASQPHLTINGALNRLTNYGPTLEGDWRIMLAAGTYAPCTVPSGLGRKIYIRIWGPSVGGHPNIPTAIIDAGGVNNQFCISAQAHISLDVRDVKLQNAPGSLAIGLAATMFCDLYTNNVHTDNITVGMQVTQNSRLRMTGGICTKGSNGVVGVAVGVTSSMSIGYQSPGFGNGPRFIGAFSQAVKITENTTGHVDYCVIDGAQVGIELSQNCRVNDVQNDIKNCTIAAIRSTQSCYANAGNTFTSNATNFINDAYSSYLPFATGSQGELRVGSVTTAITHTGTTAKTVLATPFTIPAGYFTDNSKKIRAVVRGKFTSSGSIAIGVDFGGNTIAGPASAGATSGTQFEAVMEIYATGSAAQKYHEKLFQSTSLARHGSSTRSIDMTVARALQIVGTLNASGDTLVVDSVDIYITG